MSDPARALLILVCAFDAPNLWSAHGWWLYFAIVGITICGLAALAPWSTA